MVTETATARPPYAVGERVNVLYRSRELDGLPIALNRDVTAVLQDFDGRRWHISVDLPGDTDPAWENDYILTPEGFTGFMVRSSRSACAACQSYPAGKYCAWHEDERTDP